MAASYPPEVVTKRVRRTIRPRQAYWTATGEAAGHVLQEAGAAGAERVYVTGSRPECGWRTWALRGLGEWWWPERHYYESSAAPVMRYRHADGRDLDVYVASQWFGEDATPAACARAWAVLGSMVGRAFDGATLLATPATTGRELFLRSIPYGRTWPVLDGPTQELIRSESGQGRIELLPAPAGGKVLTQLHEYDGRLMYAALCWGLPAGEPVLDDSPEYAGQVRGRYHVRVRVPEDWLEPFGLLGVKDGDGASWRYPSAPGETFTTWADGAELGVALDQGWDVSILARLLFPSLPGKGPLDSWAERLVAVREAAELAHEAEAELVTRALRAILLHGIGAFHGRDHVLTHALPLERSSEVPADAVNPRVEGPWVLYGQRTPPRWPELAHPEWSAAIWARARARLLRGPGRTGALWRAPDTDVVAFRTDALYLTQRQDWPDDRRPGRFRLVRSGTGRWPWPATSAELLALRRQLAEVPR